MATVQSTSSASPPIWMRFQRHLDMESRKSVSGSTTGVTSGESALNGTSSLSVGIVGGGMAGLYSALLLQKHIPGVKLKIFEASDRVGGCVYTQKFSSEPHQYFDTGAMRIPETESHKPVFTLIEHLNQTFPDDPIMLREYIYSCPEGNRVFFNSTKQKDGRIMSAKYANEHCSELGFPIEADLLDSDKAGKLLYDALTPVVAAFEADFNTALNRYGHITLFDYLSREEGWSQQKIRYVEAMVGHTNEFRRELVFEVLSLRRFGDIASWQTIDGGMSLLPEYCARALRINDVNILLNSKVEAIKQDKWCHIGYRSSDAKDLIYESFDAIILAIPPPHIRKIPERPNWGPDLECALRTGYFRDASKMMLRFKTRFWERPDLQLPPSQGGASLTDLPIREVMYPSHGIGDPGKGVLCFYQKGHDAEMIILLTKMERVKLALQNLQAIYPEVNIAEEYAGGTDCDDTETFLDEAICQDWPIAAVFYYPGDFLSVYRTLVTPRDSVYFAGSHLSPNSFWIVGALESAKRAVQQLMLNNFAIKCVPCL